MTYIAKKLGDDWWVYDRASGSYPIALAGYGMVRQGVENQPLTEAQALEEADKLNRYFGRPT